MRWWRFSKRISILEREIARAMSKYSDLKEALDAIAGDLAPIKSGIDSLNANLAGAVAAVKNGSVSAEDTALLDASLTEAQSLKGKFDALAATFATQGSPVPATPDPAPTTAAAPSAPPAETAPAAAPADAPAAVAAAPADGSAPTTG